MFYFYCPWTLPPGAGSTICLYLHLQLKIFRNLMFFYREGTANAQLQFVK